WLFGTALFGLIFLGFQVYEFTHFVREGLTLQRNLFGSTFFVLTGFHGGHVTVGVIWLLALLILDLRGRLGRVDAVKVEVAVLFCGPLALATGLVLALMTLTGAFLVLGR